MSDLATPVPAPEWGPPPPPPPPDDTSSGFVDAMSTTVDNIILTCSNSSNPICFSTAISGANLITNLWISAVLGTLCYAGFCLFRSRFRFYQGRLDMPQVTHKPPIMDLKGHRRLWSWLIPVFRVSDGELLLSAGMDALIAVRIISFGVLLFLPITIAAMAILVPVNYLDNWYKSDALAAGVTDPYTTVFIRLTMSNLTPGTPLMWIHFFFVYGTVFWACWLITEHYKEYITLRQHYVVRSTKVPGTALGGSAGPMTPGATPLLAPRSPHKRKAAVARALGGTSGGVVELGLIPSGEGSGGNGKVRRAVGTLHLPRRDASGSSTVGAEAVAVAGEGSGRFGSSSPLRPAGHSRLAGLSPVLCSPPTFANGVDAAAGAAVAAVDGAVTPTPATPPVQLELANGEEMSLRQRYSTQSVTSEGETPQVGLAAPPSAPPALAPAPAPAQASSALDWTTHDFSQEVLSAEEVASAEVEAAARAAAILMPPPPSRSPSRTTSGIPPTGGPPPMRQLSRMPSNAAVAAALDGGAAGTAAEALAKIRHHRALSGASAGMGRVTPNGGSTPRAGASASAEEATAAASAHPSPLKPAARPSGKPLPPPDLAGIIQKVAALSDQQPPPEWARDSPGGGAGGGGGAVMATPGGGLPTSTALAPDLASPQGQLGVAHRWWGHLSSLGNRLVDRRRSTGRHNAAAADTISRRDALGTHQSITLKGAVPLGPAAPDGGVLAANASLYTVLVTDQPIERLRLKRPLGNMEFWHQGHETNILGLQATTTGEEIEGGRPPRTPRAVSSPALADLSPPGSPADVERGEQRGNGNGAHLSVSFSFPVSAAAGGTAPPAPLPPPRQKTSRPRGTSVLADPGASERGIGLTSGWSATWNGLRQWWRHRGRYKEWRRDVRWAMFNRRVRTATEMFTELFGDDFDSIVPIYPTKSVERLIQEWDAAAAALERAQYKLRELSAAAEAAESAEGVLASTRRALGPSENKIRRVKAKIAALAAKTAALQDQISAERDEVLSDLPSTCFFATFKSQEAAAVAAQANLNPIAQRLFDVQAAPSPDDVNWPALERSWWQRQARPAYVLPLILFIMLLPIGAFTGAFAQLTIAFCGNPENPGPAADAWFCSDDRWAVFFRNLLTSIAPSLLLSIYHLVVLPVLVYYAAQAEGRCFSLSQLDRRCADLFFYWDVFNVFLGAMLGGSVLSELPQYLDNPEAIWSTLSSAIPASSNFFINYVSYRALVMAWFRLFYPHQAIVTCILKWLKIVPWAKTPRDKAVEAPVRNCRYGRDIGIPVLMNFVMVMAYAVVSPLILPFGLMYFALLWAVWRYQMLYVYQRQYESGGQFWPLVAHKVVGCLLLLVLFTATVLIFKQGYAQAAVMLATLPIYLLRFDNYLTTRYDAVVAQVPLMAAHAAGRVAGVDPDLWTPPPLRQGAAGWNPEWGKVWQWWGIPRYTL